MPALQVLIAFLAPAAAFGAATPPADDWITTATDCVAYAGADLDADSLDEVACVNLARQVWVSASVGGWKATGWGLAFEGLSDARAIALIAGDLASDSPAGELAVVYPDHVLLLGAFAGGRLTLLGRIDAPVALKPAPAPAGRAWGDGATVTDDSGTRWTIRERAFARVEATDDDRPFAPPAFEPDAPLLTTFFTDVTGDRVPDRLGVFACSRPHAHHLVRVEPGENVASGDMDSDGLSDADEASLLTDPRDRDTDDDGLLDGWEVHGLPRGVPGAPTPLNPRRQDVICAVAAYEGLEPAGVMAEVGRAKRLYAALGSTNPDGSTGIALHLREDPVIPRTDHGDWWTVGEKHLPASHRGVVHWMQIAGPGGGGQAQQTGDMGGSGSNWASFAHELGHQLSLSHEGDSGPAWCPLYPSLMNYAFSYSLGGDGEAIRFSDGRFRSVELRESSLVERLAFPIDDVRYLQAGPFHFTIQDDGAGGTLIDWNHNGRFDDQPVEADVNYGGSTFGGARRTVAPSGGSPRLVAAYGSIHLALLSPSQHAVTLRTYLGQEAWTDPREIPNSATNDDPVLVGTPGEGWALVRRATGWAAARFDGAGVASPRPIAGLPNVDLSAGVLDGRILLVGRHDTEQLESWWFEPGACTVEPGPAIDFRSSVPIDFAVDPGSGRVVMVGSATHAQAGPLCMHVAWYEWRDGSLARTDSRWVGGERAGVHCTTRPTVRFTPEGELYIFHTGWPQDDGQMTAWRTKRIGNAALNDGWLVCLMYDIWTRSRRAVSFELSPTPDMGRRHTAIYAYRWDAAEAHGTRVNDVQAAHNGLGIDGDPMRDHDDAERISKWGIRHSIMYMRRE